MKLNDFYMELSSIMGNFEWPVINISPDEFNNKSFSLKYGDMFHITHGKSPRQKIYIDIDDVIFHSARAAIKIVNEKYRIPSGLEPYVGPYNASYSIDYNLKSVYKDLTPEMVEDIFSSDEFFWEVSENSDMSHIFTKTILDNYSIIFVTKGSPVNLKSKYCLLNYLLIKHLMSIDGYNVADNKSKYHFYYVGLGLDQNKDLIDMSDGIQIDDVFDNLVDTNARVKILLTNGVDTLYNLGIITKDNRNFPILDNLYKVSSLNQIEEILNFNLIEKL